MIRLLLADDETLFRDALAMLLVGGHGKLPGDGHESARWRS